MKKTRVLKNLAKLSLSRGRQKKHEALSPSINFPEDIEKKISTVIFYI
jgi:hypothetical protein